MVNFRKFFANCHEFDLLQPGNMDLLQNLWRHMGKYSKPGLNLA